MVVLLYSLTEVEPRVTKTFIPHSFLDLFASKGKLQTMIVFFSSSKAVKLSMDQVGRFLILLRHTDPRHSIIPHLFHDLFISL